MCILLMVLPSSPSASRCFVDTASWVDMIVRVLKHRGVEAFPATVGENSTGLSFRVFTRVSSQVAFYADVRKKPTGSLRGHVR